MVYACPGCTLFASVSAAFGSAFGNVPTGLVKLVMLKRLKNSDRSSRLRPPAHRNPLRHHQVNLAEPRPVNRVAFEIAERPRLRGRERRRVQEDQPAVLDERIHARNHIRSARAARGAAARNVDHRRQTRRRVVEHVPRGIDKDDVGRVMSTGIGTPLRPLKMPPISQPPAHAPWPGTV